ncbi:MAG: YdcF family protein [Planctomycetota bacterium]
MAPPLTRVLEDVLLPPGGLFLGVFGGLVLWRTAAASTRGRRIGALAAVASAAALVTLSVPAVAYALLASLQGEPHLAPDVDALDVGAIVVLAGDVTCDPAEYGSDQPGALSLERCRYGARLARRTGVPLLVTGGVLRPDRRAVSLVLADFIEDELHVPVRWTEERAVDTRQNAVFTAELLRRDGVDRVALVTHAWHMPRARAAFEAAGLDVLPAPMAAASPPASTWDALRPRMKAFRDSGWAIHEWIGRLWYAVR